MSDPRYHNLYERDERRRNESGIIRFLLAAISGILLPVHYSGKLYLVRELQKCGVDTSTLPEACLRDLTDQIIYQCKEQGRFEGHNWRG